MQKRIDHSKFAVVRRSPMAPPRVGRSTRPGYGRFPAGLAIALIALAVLPGSAAGPRDLKAAAAVAWTADAYGYAFNVKTIEEAEELAKASAIKNGAEADAIEILATSKVVGYGAIAVDGNIVGVTMGYPDLRAAIVRAKQECQKRGGRFPRVVATWHDRGY